MDRFAMTERTDTIYKEETAGLCPAARESQEEALLLRVVPEKMLKAKLEYDRIQSQRKALRRPL